MQVSRIDARMVPFAASLARRPPAAPPPPPSRSPPLPCSLVRSSTVMWRAVGGSAASRCSADQGRNRRTCVGGRAQGGGEPLVTRGLLKLSGWRDGVRAQAARCKCGALLAAEQGAGPRGAARHLMAPAAAGPPQPPGPCHTLMRPTFWPSLFRWDTADSSTSVPLPIAMTTRSAWRGGIGRRREPAAVARSGTRGCRTAVRRRA